MIDNRGYVFGGLNGVYDSGGGSTIMNSGTIESPAYAISVTGGQAVTTTIINTTTYDSRDLAIEAVPGVTASNNLAVGSGNPLHCLNVLCT